jgi:predicted nuclease with TOPRIM domain
VKEFNKTQEAMLQLKEAKEETARLIRENQVLYMKVQSIKEEISNVEKEQETLLKQLYDLPKEVILPAAKDVIVEENNLDKAQSMATLPGKGAGSGLSKKPVQGPSCVHSDAAKPAHGAVVRIALENAVKGPGFGQPLREVQVTLHVKEVVASKEPKPKLGGDSSIPLGAGSVCLDYSNLAISKNACALPGALLECPVKAPL